MGSGGRRDGSTVVALGAFDASQSIISVPKKMHKSSSLLAVKVPVLLLPALFDFSFLLHTPAALTSDWLSVHHSLAILYRRAPHCCRAFPVPPVVTTIVQFVVVVICTALLVNTSLLFADDDQFLIPQSIFGCCYAVYPFANTIGLDVSVGIAGLV